MNSIKQPPNDGVNPDNATPPPEPTQTEPDSTPADQAEDKHGSGAGRPRINVEALMRQMETSTRFPKIDVEALKRQVETSTRFPKVDVEALMRRLDNSARYPKVDVEALTRRAETSAKVPQVDIEALMRRLDNSVKLPQVDLESLMRRIHTSTFTPDLDRLFEAAADHNRELIRTARRNLLPRNLRDSDVSLDDALTLMEDGFPFALIPDATTAHLLTQAATGQQRRQVLVDRKEAVLATCKQVIALCVGTETAPLGSQVRKAVNAARDGHNEAAQALATNVFDRLVKNHASAGMLINRTEAPRILEPLPHRDAFFLTPIPGAHAKAYTNSPPVDGFSRHATAHQVGSIQYSEANCIHAIMLATSLLGYWQGLW